ncbi:hypothetical protein [Bradyrhizobium sp. JYMT SZCCT0428]|uniref:hypothetical protein n=1 Tax=Bradyrhizobium sp. JYMT SZCCT0428 TaxID=2807673 RepID=UPI001BACE8B2|nr:hypothetical protein [Bradyrhizobium sp. JYMT SZCCT0428]MBR1156103.1 hypothetical protein [Bradyrhizobium sp. JYMT SZCCT0428]
MKRNSRQKPVSRKQPAENPFDRIFKTVLLRSESERGFKVFRNEIYAELDPRTPIQHLVARQQANDRLRASAQSRAIKMLRIWVN